jgi:integrase
MATSPKLALQPSPWECIVSAEAIESTGKGGSLARKRFQKGTLFLRGKNPVWVGRYREDVIGPDGQVRRERKAIVLGTKREYPTKHLAERRMDVLLARINDYSYRPSRVSTLGEFAERWKLEILSKRKASTVHGYESHLKNQILPHLGKLRLDQLGVEYQQTFVTRISGTVSRTTVRNILATLSSILATAKNWGYTCEGVHFDRLVFPEREVRPERKGFSPAQAAQIIARAQGQFRAMFAIAAMTGLRVGEILGLESSDFDFDNRVFQVRRSVWRGKLQTPKNANSVAALPLPDTLAEIVREHIKTVKPGFLFLNNRGSLFTAENVVRQELVPILKQLQIPIVARQTSFHAFRHLHASMLLAAGAPAPVAQAQLRHSDPRITLGIYAHVIGDAHREFVDSVAKNLDSFGLNMKPQTDSIQ